MRTNETPDDPPRACREHRALGVGWDPETRLEHARTCADCRRHDAAVARAAVELRVLASTPVRDLWGGIAARTPALRRSSSLPVWAARCAAALLGVASVTGAMCALERVRALRPVARVEAPPAAFAALSTRSDQALFASVPEIQLLAQLAPIAEDGR